MLEKECKIDKTRKDHSEQLGEVSRRNTKVKEILRDVIEEKQESGSGSQSDSSPPSSPDRVSSPLSPGLEEERQIAVQLNAVSEDSQLATRRVYQRKHRQGTTLSLYAPSLCYCLILMTAVAGERKAFKQRRGAVRVEETCPINTSAEQECALTEEGPTHFTKGGIHQPRIIFGKRGTNPDEFKYPRGLAIDVSGDIFVVDSENPCIRVWSSDGVFKKAFGTIGSGNNDFGCPWGIAIHQEKVYVSDIEKHKVFVYKTNGKYITSFGKEGVSINCLKEPRGIYASEDGDIYIADSENNRIQVFSESLKHKCFIGEEQLVKPRDVFVDSKENVYVLDWGSSCIHVYNSSGELQREFGQIGNDSKLMTQPW